MFEDPDLDSREYRWPMIRSRLERACTDFFTNLNNLADEVHYAGLASATVRGTPFTTYCTGSSIRAHDPKSLEWISDERLIEEFDLSLDKLYRELYKKLMNKPSRLTWRLKPYVDIVFPPSTADVIRGHQYLVLPRVYYRMRLAIESIEH